MRAARATIKKVAGSKQIVSFLIILFERKTGGLLPSLQIFARLSTLGSLNGGSGSNAKVIILAKIAKKKPEEEKRHNAAAEEIGKNGSRLYLKTSPNGGYGLCMKQKNFQ